jgi:hypothetical protein
MHCNHSNFRHPCVVQFALLTCKIIRTTVSITIDIIPPPLRERSRHTTRSGNRETQQENHNLGSTIHARRHQIVPLNKLLRAIFPEVPLANVANDEVDPDGGVDADDKVAHVPEDDGEVKVAPDELMGEELVHDVEGNRENEAEEVGGGDPLVALAE